MRLLRIARDVATIIIVAKMAAPVIRRLVYELDTLFDDVDPPSHVSESYP